MRIIFPKRYASGWAILSGIGKETVLSSIRQTSPTRHDSAARPRTCTSWNDSRASHQTHCCTASRSKIRRHGRVRGRASIPGLQPINRFTNTPATKTTTLSKTFCAERAGVKRMRRRRRRSNEVSHYANTNHHDSQRRCFTERRHCSPRSPCVRKRVRSEPAGPVEGQDRQSGMGQSACVDSYGGLEFRRDERRLDDRGGKSEFPAPPRSHEGVLEGRHGN